ncbi:hypothetical protein ACWDYH_38915 [Nocardia goodfellowii]
MLIAILLRQADIDDAKAASTTGSEAALLREYATTARARARELAAPQDMWQRALVRRPLPPLADLLRELEDREVSKVIKLRIKAVCGNTAPR